MHTATPGRGAADQRCTVASVRIDHPQEFRAELIRDKRRVHRGLVRLTTEPTPPDNDLVLIVAGYLLQTAQSLWQVVELQCRCSTRITENTDARVPHAEHTRGLLEQAIADAGLEWRPGRLRGISANPPSA